MTPEPLPLNLLQAAAFVTASTTSSTARCDQVAIVAFRHHADHRLRAGRADDQPPAAAQPRLGASIAADHRLLLERLARL